MCLFKWITDVWGCSRCRKAVNCFRALPPAPTPARTRKTTPEARPSDSGIFFSPPLLPFLLMSMPKRPALRVEALVTGMRRSVRKKPSTLTAAEVRIEYLARSSGTCVHIQTLGAMQASASHRKLARGLIRAIGCLWCDQRGALKRDKPYRGAIGSPPPSWRRRQGGATMRGR